MARQISDETRWLLDQLADEVFPGESIEAVERMGGLTNFTFAVTMPSGKYVFRLPGEGTERLIDRHDEKVSNELAASLGIDARLIYFNAEKGTKVSDYIEQAVTMSPESMREQRNIEDAARLFHRLHFCGQDTGVGFDVFAMAAHYEDIIQSNGVPLYPDYEQVADCVSSIKDRTDRFAAPNAPCHNDSLCENWVRSPERLYLVDWEYAGMNDPLWDLADVSIEASYTGDMDELLLSTYFEGPISDEARFRFAANKVLLDFLWSLWGKTRVPYDGDVMEAYAFNRYARLKRTLADPILDGCRPGLFGD